MGGSRYQSIPRLHGSAATTLRRVTERADDIPTHRYTAALANEIEHTWQDRWDAEHVFWTPESHRAAAPRTRATSPTGPSLFVLDMFPYPSGVGLHVGHPLGFIATDVYARFQPHERLQRAARDGLRRVRAARPSSTRCRRARTRASPPRRTSPT